MHLHKFDNYRELFSGRARLEIGVEVLINYPVFIHSSVSSISLGDKSVIGESVVFGSSTLIGSNDYDGIVIGEGCIIGAGTKIADGVNIGEYSMIQDDSLIIEDVGRNEAATHHMPASGIEKACARILSRQSDEDLFKQANFELENLNYDDSKKLYLELLNKERRPEILHNMAIAHIASGDRQKGEEYLKESLEQLGSYVDAKRSLANMSLFEAERLHLPLTERFIRTSTILVK